MFDIENDIPSSLEKEYEFKYAHEADNFNDVIVEEGSDTSKEDTPFHYSGIDDSFPTLAEMFKEQNEDELRRKVVEKITTEGIPQTVLQETLLEGKKNWFKVYVIHREQGVQYFEFLSDIQTLPWWDVEELVFLDWKPQYPKQDIKIDPVTKYKDISLIIKPPRCLKNMPLHAMEQDFYEDFQGWMYNQSTAEAVISLFGKKTGESRRISVLDPMWLVNCSKKDTECLFYNKIVYEKPDKVKAQQYQKLLNLCYAKDINSCRYWKSKFRDLEIDEFLNKYKHSQRFKEIADKAAKLGRWKLMRPPPTDQAPIEKEENKIPRWDRKRDGDPEYRKYWNEVGRPLRRKMIAERDEKKRQKSKARRRSRKTT
ncbi:hypothetical protein Hanom_Chr03g00209101 [Helianthus anomalus]